MFEVIFIITNIMSCPQINICRQSDLLKKTNESNSSKMHEPVTKKVKNYIFKLNDILGKGSFSTVYKGFHQTTQEIVAIKVVELNRVNTNTLSSLLKTQIQTLKSMNHRNVVTCHDVYFSATNCYIITEFCNDGDLKNLLAKQGSLEELRASKIIRQVYEGLKYLEQLNIVHRDFKSSNVLLSNGCIRIADFGFAKKSKQDFKDINIGSPMYMSPQGIVNNTYGPKTDVWAFGIFIFQLLHGKSPFYFCQSHSELKQAILTPISEKLLNPSISKELKALIMDCLQVDPQKRISMKMIDRSSYFVKMRQADQNQMIISVVEEFIQAKDNSLISTQATGISSNRQIMMTRTPYLAKDTSCSVNKRIIENRNSSYQRSLKYRYRSTNNVKPTNYGSKQFVFPSYSRKQNTSIQHKKSQKSQKQQSASNHPQFTKTMNRFARNDRESLNRTQINSSKNMRDNDRRGIQFQSQGIKNIKDFRDLVALVHYCRILFKTIKISQKKYLIKVQDLYNWLFQIIKDVLQSINKIQNPSMNIQELKKITLEYQQKYSEESGLRRGGLVCLQQVKCCILEGKRRIRAQSMMGDEQSGQINSHLGFVFELTELLEQCMKSNNFRQFSLHNGIEDFLMGKSSKLRGHCGDGR